MTALPEMTTSRVHTPTGRRRKTSLKLQGALIRTIEQEYNVLRKHGYQVNLKS